MNKEVRIRYPKEELRKVDKEQNRQVISPAALNAIAVSLPALMLLKTALDELEPLLKEHKLLAKAKSAYTMSLNAYTGLLDFISVVQIDTLAANIENTTVKLSSEATGSYGFVNIQTEQLLALTSATQRGICGNCFKTDKAALSCRIRIALDNSLCVDTRYDIRNYFGVCPYCSGKVMKRAPECH